MEGDGEEREKRGEQELVGREKGWEGKGSGGASLQESPFTTRGPGREFLEWGCPELSTAVLGEAA